MFPLLQMLFSFYAKNNTNTSVFYIYLRFTEQKKFPRKQRICAPFCRNKVQGTLKRKSIFMHLEVISCTDIMLINGSCQMNFFYPSGASLTPTIAGLSWLLSFPGRKLKQTISHAWVIPTREKKHIPSALHLVH